MSAVPEALVKTVLEPPPPLARGRTAPRHSATATASTFFRGLLIGYEVVAAVVLRETRTRFGALKLGYLWALLEPAIVIFTFYAFFRIYGRQPPAGMDLFGFIATGVVPYTLFTNSINRVAESVNGNKALLYYPQVRPIDLIAARSALELATFAAVFLILMGGNVLARQALDIESPLAVIGGFLLASALGTGLGIVFCGLGQLTPAIDRVRGPLLRPLFWISGIFFTADSLPDRAREAMLWNPVLHVNELIRDGWFPAYDDAHVSIGYVLVWVVGLALVGLVLERLVRRHIEMS